MKRFIIISLLAVQTVSALACYDIGTHNYYLFSTVGAMDWENSVRERTMENWRAYAGKQDLYWFDADELSTVARKKGDVLMVSYIAQLQKYMEVVGQIRETWEYPTKKQLLERTQALQGIKKYAFSKTKTRLRSQHALLYMRCNMMLGMHQTNVLFWEQTAVKFINSVYRDMMRNIYAGALLKVGRTDEATQIFMEQGDQGSLYTYYYKKRSLEAIRAEYERDANAAALPFLVQDFANNAQEAIDAQSEYGIWRGKLFVRDIKQQEAMQMCAFAEQVLREGKTKNPALWKSLEAWLRYLFGEKAQALKNIRQAVTMNGGQRIKDNARVLHLYIESAMANNTAQQDNLLVGELTWLEGKSREERGAGREYENHYTHVYDRLVHQVLIPSYDAAGRTNVATAFLAVYDEQPKVFRQSVQQGVDGEDYWNDDYSTEFFERIDEMPVEQLVSYKDYVNGKPATALDRWLSARLRHDNEFLNELIGTKYLRLGRWTKAVQYLSLVSIDFVNKMNIVPFMAHRDYRVEPWRTRQRVKEELQYPGTVKVTRNQKVEFAKEMASLEEGLGMMKVEERAKRAYDLAVRYAQASYAGDAWYLTHYGKSIYDTARVGELDMVKKAAELLAVANSLNDFEWEERTLYAQAWLPLDPWCTEEWSSEKMGYVKLLHPQSRQYKALLSLYYLGQRDPARTSYYVSHCDVLKQFAKTQK